MKAYQVWMVAREPATLKELARALLRESDSRENCELFNEALTVADKVNLARSHFGRAVHALRPLYVVLTMPAPEVLAPLSRQMRDYVTLFRNDRDSTTHAAIDFGASVPDYREGDAALRFDPLPPGVASPSIAEKAKRIKGVITDDRFCARCGGPSGPPRSGRCDRCGDSLGIIEYVPLGKGVTPGPDTLPYDPITTYHEGPTVFVKAGPPLKVRQLCACPGSRVIERGRCNHCGRPV